MKYVGFTLLNCVFVAAACAGDGDDRPSSGRDAETDAGPSTGGWSGAGGNTSGSGGNPTAATGGAGGTTHMPPTNPGSGGSPMVGSGGAVGGGGTPGSGGTSAGPDAGDACDSLGDTGVTVDICERLVNPSRIATDMALRFMGRVHNDCRIARMVDENPARSTFGNDVVQWSLRLWGCREAGTRVFGIADLTNFPRITAEEAGALIDAYMAVAVTPLTLSGAEVDQMRLSLECLARNAIDPLLNAGTLSSCAPGDAGSVPDAPIDSSSPPDAGIDAEPVTDGAADAADIGAPPDATGDVSDADAHGDGGS